MNEDHNIENFFNESLSDFRLDPPRKKRKRFLLLLWWRGLWGGVGKWLLLTFIGGLFAGWLLFGNSSGKSIGTKTSAECDCEEADKKESVFSKEIKIDSGFLGNQIENKKDNKTSKNPPLIKVEGDSLVEVINLVNNKTSAADQPVEEQKKSTVVKSRNSRKRDQFQAIKLKAIDVDKKGSESTISLDSDLGPRFIEPPINSTVLDQSVLDSSNTIQSGLDSSVLSSTSSLIDSLASQDSEDTLSFNNLNLDSTIAMDSTASLSIEKKENSADQQKEKKLSLVLFPHLSYGVWNANKDSVRLKGGVGGALNVGLGYQNFYFTSGIGMQLDAFESSLTNVQDSMATTISTSTHYDSTLIAVNYDSNYVMLPDSSIVLQIDTINTYQQDTSLFSDTTQTIHKIKNTYLQQTQLNYLTIPIMLGRRFELTKKHHLIIQGGILFKSLLNEKQLTQNIPLSLLRPVTKQYVLYTLSSTYSYQINGKINIRGGVQFNYVTSSFIGGQSGVVTRWTGLLGLEYFFF